MHIIVVIIKLILVLLASFILNLPLGMWKGKIKKFSISWFIATHLAVPVIYFLRVTEGLSYWTIPLIIAAAVYGQLVGTAVVKKQLKARQAQCEQQEAAPN